MAIVMEFLTDLSYLLGEDTVPTSGIEYRIGFINHVVDDISSRRKWSWLEKDATVTITSQVGTLPTDYRQGGVISVKDTDNNLYQETVKDLIDETTDPYIFYITGNETDGFSIFINNESFASINIRYSTEAPVFTSSGNTTDFPIPLRLAVAKGALIDVRRYENPFYDVSPETMEYENEIRKLYRIERQTKKSNQQISAKGWFNGTTV